MLSDRPASLQWDLESGNLVVEVWPIWSSRVRLGEVAARAFDKYTVQGRFERLVESGRLW